MALHSYGTGRSDGHELTEQLSVNPLFARPGETTSVPKHRLPAGSMSPATAYQIVHDHLMLDGNARLNLATFVTTWMEPEADRLMAECLDKNMIDKDEYPQTAELELRCVNMLAQLWNAPGPVQPPCRRSGARRSGPARHACSPGWRSSGAGSSGAARRGPTPHAQPGDGRQRPGLLGQVLQLLRGGAALRADGGRAASISTPSRPSPCATRTPSGSSRCSAPPSTAATSRSRRSSAALDDLQSRTGLDIPVHVDGASGAMVAPFLDPDLEWDFRLPRVASINTSGHKYGLVYPGSAGCCGGTPMPCRRSWSSRSTTSAARCRPSR